jgi:hypothetical protein
MFFQGTNRLKQLRTVFTGIHQVSGRHGRLVFRHAVITRTVRLTCVITFLFISPRVTQEPIPIGKVLSAFLTEELRFPSVMHALFMTDDVCLIVEFFITVSALEWLISSVN